MSESIQISFNARFFRLALASIMLLAAAAFSIRGTDKLEQNELLANFKVNERLLIGSMGISCVELEQNGNAKDRQDATVNFMENVTKMEHLMLPAKSSIEILKLARALVLKAAASGNSLERNDPSVLQIYRLIRFEAHVLDKEIHDVQEKNAKLIQSTKSAQTIVWLTVMIALVVSVFGTKSGRPHD